MVYNYDPETDLLQTSHSEIVKSNGCTPLMHAILQNNEELVKEILKNDTSVINTVNAQSNDGLTALHIVARSSKVWNLFKYLQLLLDMNAMHSIDAASPLLNGIADPNIQDKYGYTALMYAALYSKTYSSEETVRILLEHNANPNLQNNIGRTALMYAAKYSKTDSSEETVRILLGFKANPNIQDYFGKTALMLSAKWSKKNSSEETVRMLLGIKANPSYPMYPIADPIADPNIQDEEGQTALMCAARWSKSSSTEETVRMLLGLKSDPNIQDNYGQTSLMYAARYSRTDSSEETVRILLGFKANPNLQDNYGETALMMAAIYDDSTEETIRILLENDADPKIKDNNGNDVVEKTKMYIQDIKIRNQEKRIKELEHEIELLKLQPIPGINFINTFIEEFGEDDQNLTDKFIEGYIPILKKYLKNIIKK